ncbi:MAG: tyrosine-type recombinase/integrase [Actinoplanes sp.]
MVSQVHPDFEALLPSWTLAIQADGYSANTLTAYRHALRKLAGWMAEHHPGVGPEDMTRDHIRGWLVDLRQTRSKNTARTWFPGVRHFFRWAIDEQEITVDPTEGIRTPTAGETRTDVLKHDEIRALLAVCTGSTFIARRDSAIIMILADGGLRLAEIAGLQVSDADLLGRMLFVAGKGTNRSGPRRRAVPIGIKAARALDRYLRERRKHPYAELPWLWLGGRGHPRLRAASLKERLTILGERAGVPVHPHMFRHTWASEFRAAGGEEGDLMVLGGWRSRTMLDRYGKVVAADRAQAAYRRRSLGDKL